MRPPPVSLLYEYEIASGIKIKLCLDDSKREVMHIVSFGCIVYT